MRSIPESLKVGLRDFCHMEWYETDELREMAINQNASDELMLFVHQFKIELESAIELAYITPDQYLEITSCDLENNEQVVEILKKIHIEVFGQ